MHSPIPENDLFLKACRREPVSRTPVWVMRQAGRYLPEYRAVRERHDFLTMVKTPELAAEVTVQPIDIVGTDAAILFSDIMTVPEAMGMSLSMVEGKGPVLADPLRSATDVERLVEPDTEKDLGYVAGAIRATLERLENRVPLIGFSGSPWTLAAYMVEGSGSREFRHARSLLYAQPKVAHRLLDRLVDTVSAYLSMQIDAGVHAVQIFDTWGGILVPDHYREFSLGPITRIVERISGAGVPVIVFSKDCAHSLDAIASCGADVVGLDWRSDLGAARERVGSKVALQGNLDPVSLFAPEPVVRARVRAVIDSFGPHPGHVFNLGHGILPETPVENVRALVDELASYTTKRSVA